MELSGPSISTTIAIASIAIGAGLIVERFTLDRNGEAQDNSFSDEPLEVSEREAVRYRRA